MRWCPHSLGLLGQPRRRFCCLSVTQIAKFGLACSSIRLLEMRLGIIPGLSLGLSWG